MKKENLFVREISHSSNTGKKKAETKLRIVWLHGWGLNHRHMLPLAEMFNTSEVENLLVDLPGFGRSDVPKEIWGTKDYAECIYNWLKEKDFIPVKGVSKSKSSSTPILFIGHSFGARVIINLVNEYPKLKNAKIIFIGGAGIKRKRSLTFRIKAKWLKFLSRCASGLDNIFKSKLKEKFGSHFGSYDYRHAKGIMRPILVKTVNEDLSKIAKNISQPSLLIYGSDDDITPPEFGRKYAKIMQNAKFVEVANMDHNSILREGKHQVSSIIEDFITLE